MPCCHALPLTLGSNASAQTKVVVMTGRCQCGQLAHKHCICCRALREVNDRLVGDKDVYDVMRKEEPRGRSLKSGVIDEAEDLCRQLQNRLEGLSEMGGRLEKQNRGASDLVFPIVRCV